MLALLDTQRQAEEDFVAAAHEARIVEFEQGYAFGVDWGHVALTDQTNAHCIGEAAPFRLPPPSPVSGGRIPVCCVIASFPREAGKHQQDC